MCAVAACGDANRAGRLAALGMRVYAIGVDKSGLLVRGKEEFRRNQAAQNRRKKLLRPLTDSARVGLSHRCSCSPVSGSPLRRVFFF
jgi:hypothetical protein